MTTRGKIMIEYKRIRIEKVNGVERVYKNIDGPLTYMEAICEYSEYKNNQPERLNDSTFKENDE